MQMVTDFAGHLIDRVGEWPAVLVCSAGIALAVYVLGNVALQPERDGCQLAADEDLQLENIERRGR